MRDELGLEPAAHGSVVLNYGDPAYRARRDQAQELKFSEDIFLRILSYLPFAETVIIPGRHLLDGDDMFEAGVWAKPLLRAKLIVPEIREGPKSFGDLARQRKLNARALQRADFVDHNASCIRRFRWDELSTTYTNLLAQHLSPDGAFRRLVVGGIKGKLRNELDAAYDSYLASKDVTPDGFVKAVARNCNSASTLARQWAMAHYYMTPTMFDDLNIRQIPKSASDLLIKAGELDESIRRVDMVAPAELLRHELTPALHALDIEKNSDAYCDALQRVRQDIPEARMLFKGMWDKVESKDAAEMVAELMKKELEKQLKRRITDSRMFSLTINVGGAIAGGVAGGLAGLPFGPMGSIAAGTGVGAAATGATWQAERKLQEKLARRNRPWKLVIDRFTSEISNKNANK